MELADSEIHLWFASLEDFPLPELEAQCLQWLSEQERARYHRYRLEKSRHELLLGQVLTRLALSEYQQKTPGEWEFAIVANGKPVISQARNLQPLFFNLTHSNGRAVLAVGRHEMIGVDLEVVKAKRRIRKIAERHFSSMEVEQLLLLGGEAQLSRFFELWTLKESYIKATGEGLQVPLDSFGFDLSTDEVLRFWLRSQDRIEAAAWYFWQLDCGAEYRLALACCPKGRFELNRIRSFKRTRLGEINEFELGVLRAS